MKSSNSKRPNRTRKALLGVMIALLAFESYFLISGIVEKGGVSAYWEARRADHERAMVVDVINDHFVGGPVLRDGVGSEAELSEVVSQLDRYSVYMNENQTKWLREETDQEFGGVGIRIDRGDGFLEVLAPIADTPAARAGLQRGDRIVEVDGRSLEGRDLEDIVSGLRGRPGTKVSMAIERPSTSERFDVLIERAVIPVASVRGTRMLSGDIGYVRIEQFGVRTGVELGQSVDQLVAQGMRNLVLDLRGNPGGLLDAAVEVATPFLREGQLIVSIKGRGDRETDRRVAKGQAGRYDFPVVILVNQGSASASEIVAAALRDWKRATLVGETTFGKGSVQSVIELDDNKALRLTTARYFTPGNYVIEGVGLEPDLSVPLDHGEARRLARQRWRLEYVSESEYEAEFGEPLADDRQLQAAIAALQPEAI